MRPDRPGGQRDAAAAERPMPAATTPDAEVWLTQWRARAWRRWRALIALEAALWATAAGATAQAFTGSALVAVAAGLGVGIGRTLLGRPWHDVQALLRAAESAGPTLGNALLAWHHVERGTLDAPPRFRVRLATHARTALEGASWPTPRRRRNWMLAGTAVLLGVVAATVAPRLRGPDDTAAAVPAVARPSSPGALAAVTASYVVTPPAYTGRPSSTLRDTANIEALIGSRVRATFVGLPDGARVDAGGTPLDLGAEGDGRTAELTVEQSLLLTAADADGQPLLSTALQAVADRPPLVRIAAPGEDLRTDDTTRRVPIVVDASDDLGLASVRVRYTRVSGSGESFEFVDGELPVSVERGTTAWRARGTIDLGTLGMGPGDSLVYWAVARDGRLDATGLSESERYLVEIPRPGQLAAGDFSLPDPENRYALSQRMVILLTERLLERRPRLSAAEYLQEAQGLAVQQRRVRAEFVFLMGGEVVDEVEEAEHSHEVEAGRLVNSGQRELLEAVRQMAQAEQRLTDARLDDALPFEYRALNALQAAFGKARYFMRTLPTTVAIDVSRRGSGDLALADAAAWTRAPLVPSEAAEVRRLLRHFGTLGPQTNPAEVVRVGDALLALEATRAEWLPVVQRLTAAFAPGGAVSDREEALAATGDALRRRLVQHAPGQLVVPLPVGSDEAAMAAAGVQRP